MSDPKVTRQQRTGAIMTDRKSRYDMIPVKDAIEIVLRESAPLNVVTATLQDALGRRLAQDVLAKDNLPPFPASIMDGYAVVASDGTGEFPVVGRLTAGVDAAQSLQPGMAAYITTGAPVPSGADAVVKIEDTEGIDDPTTGVEAKVRILVGVKAGANIRPTGCDIARGQLVLPAGTILSAADLGLLATVGVVDVPVYATPVVGVLSTGNELVEPREGSLPAGKIRDSNRVMLMAAIRDAGAQVIDLGIAEDNAETQEEFLKQALERVDILVTSGGVSMGELDLIKPLYESLGTIHFGRLLMKPGKPTTFATVQTGHDDRKKLCFALPGNPVSCFVCFHLLVLPAIKKLSGASDGDCLHPKVDVTVLDSLKLDPERPEYHRATVFWELPEASSHAGHFVAASTGNQASSRLLSAHRANALLCLPQAHGYIQPGQVVSAMLINTFSTVPRGTAARYAETSSAQPSKPHTQDHSSTLSIRVGILTVSDRAHRGQYEDESGPTLKKHLTDSSASTASRNFLEKVKIAEVLQEVVPDDLEEIQKIIRRWADEERLDLIISTGGTGFAPRDVTPEAIKPMLEKEAPGIVFGLLNASIMHTPFAVVSRPVAGVRRSAFIVTLPGSPRAVRENLEALLPVLAHVLGHLREHTHGSHVTHPPTQ